MNNPRRTLAASLSERIAWDTVRPGHNRYRVARYDIAGNEEISCVWADSLTQAAEDRDRCLPVVGTKVEIIDEWEEMGINRKGGM